MTSLVKAPSCVAVIGLGKLGAPMVAAIAAHNISVIGVDLDSAKVAALKRGEAPVRETQLGEYIHSHNKRLSATTDIGEAVRDAQIVFTIVPTPSELSGGFSLRHVLPVCEQIGTALRQKREFTVVVITSTVMPGATEGPIRECLEKMSGKKAGKGFGLCYSPEFIALGSVIHDFLNPDLILVGESDPRSGEIMDAFYGAVCENAPFLAHMNFVNAELSKLAVNTYVTTKIAYANMLARICERLPGGDVDVVTGAIGHDARIGSKYLKGAVGYGGPCFPRDNIAMSQVAHLVGADAALAETTHRENNAEVERLSALIHRYLSEGARVGVLGISYKPLTEVIEQSPGLKLAQKLLDEGVEVVVYDPAAMDAAQLVLGDRAQYAGSAEDCLRQSDVAVITTPWSEFAHIDPAVCAGRRAPLTLIDAWRIAPPDLRARLRYIPLGAYFAFEQDKDHSV
jgi:UDPglucose 6-dehydrogenase